MCGCWKGRDPVSCHLPGAGSRRGWGCGALPELSPHADPHPPVPCPLGLSGGEVGVAGQEGLIAPPTQGNSPVSLERLQGTCTRPRRGDRDPDPYQPAAPSPRDTQEPITGPRGRAAAPWVRRAAGRSCLRGPGLTRGAGAAGGRAGKGPRLRWARPPLRRVVPAAAAASRSSSCQHRGRGGPRDRSLRARSVEPREDARAFPAPGAAARRTCCRGLGWGLGGGLGGLGDSGRGRGYFWPSPHVTW